MFNFYLSLSINVNRKQLKENEKTQPNSSGQNSATFHVFPSHSHHQLPNLTIGYVRINFTLSDYLKNIIIATYNCLTTKCFLYVKIIHILYLLIRGAFGGMNRDGSGQAHHYPGSNNNNNNSSLIPPWMLRHVSNEGWNNIPESIIN